MKKVIIIILLICTLGCSNKKTIIEEEEKPKDTEEEIIEEYIDDNPIVIGLYENDLTLVHEYTTTKVNGKDIVFGTYYTNDDSLGSRNQKYNWNRYYSEYNDIDKYKIGYYISFYSGEQKIEKTVLGPDSYVFSPYFYIYLYDDIHQEDGKFYSHVNASDVTDDTIFSSIKLYLVDVDKITSSIELTAFTYDGLEDFDEFGNYRGNSKYTISINWK